VTARVKEPIHCSQTTAINLSESGPSASVIAVVTSVRATLKILTLELEVDGLQSLPIANLESSQDGR
jgi:hypothetical protein